MVKLKLLYTGASGVVVHSASSDRWTQTSQWTCLWPCVIESSKNFCCCYASNSIIYLSSLLSNGYLLEVVSVCGPQGAFDVLSVIKLIDHLVQLIWQWSFGDSSRNFGMNPHTPVMHAFELKGGGFSYSKKETYSVFGWVITSLQWVFVVWGLLTLSVPVPHLFPSGVIKWIC